jgi:hypothetical protein
VDLTIVSFLILKLRAVSMLAIYMHTDNDYVYKNGDKFINSLHIRHAHIN